MKRTLSVIAVALLLTVMAVPAFAQKRVALVIGNGSYAILPDLRNPVNDATDIAAALEKFGFSVTLKTNADRRTMNQAIIAFREELASDQQSEGVFYFAGHGVQSSKGENFLMPVDAAVKSEADLEDEAVRARKLLDSLDEARNRVNLVILDACRDNPLPAVARSSASRGLAVISQAPPETVLLFSTAAGQTASDGASGSRNSPFTAALLKHLYMPSDITQVIKLVTGEVKATTPEKQTPFVYSNLSRDFVLNKSDGLVTSASPASSNGPSFGAVSFATGKLSVQLATAGTVSVAGLSAEVPAGTVPINDLAVGSQTVTVRYADGTSESRTVTVPAGGTASVSFTYTPAAPVIATGAPRGPSSSGASVKDVPESPGRVYRSEVWVAGGSFRMGSDTGEIDDKPVHTVTLSGFWMMNTEVTQRDYAALMGVNPSHFKGDDLPVERVTWYDAVAYANKLSHRDGLAPAYAISGSEVSWDPSANGWRLPTEAEWEYAAYGGPKARGRKVSAMYAGSSELDSVAWYSDNSGRKTHQVATRAPNALGLYDMVGNVGEWCWDRFGNYGDASQSDPTGAAVGSLRVQRGGSWGARATYTRSTYRSSDAPGSSNLALGFRLVRRP